MAEEQPKTNAAEYLEEYAANYPEPWLQTLVDGVIASNGLLDDELIDLVYEEFLVFNSLKKQSPDTDEEENSIPETTKEEAVSEGNFILTKVLHHSGVNALRAGSILPLHPKLTVVYGKNGSGKSGFVRIFKKIANSRTQEEIWQNIHKVQTQNDCKAEITYQDTESEKTYSWTGESKVHPFHQIAIFDGKSIPVLLNKSLDFSYQPYGFELFPIISDSLQRLQQKLNSHIHAVQESQPPIHDLFNSDTKIGELIHGVDANTNLASFKLPNWTKFTQTKLEQAREQKRGLQNLDAQFELLQSRLQKITSLQDSLESVKETFSNTNLKIYQGLINEYLKLKQSLVKKKDKTLEEYEIPDQNSQEWEKFIDAADDYIRFSEHEEYPKDGDICIYCRQKLSKTSQKLIQLYKELFLEEEVSDIENVEEKLDEQIQEIEEISFLDDLAYEEKDYKNLIPKDLTSKVFSIIKEGDDIAVKVVKSLQQKKVANISAIKIGNTANQLQKVREVIESQIQNLRETQQNIFTKSQEYDSKILYLEDLQKFNKYKKLIETYIAKAKWIAKAGILQSTKFSTRSITDIGMRAWKEIVSESFISQFQKESAFLKSPDVKLEFRGEYGSQMRNKSLEGLNQIDQILSEGEQKAVALADFFAEISMQVDKNPIVLDDPATSFDHARKEMIAERIVQESANRQVLVFTHDLMFAHYIHERVIDPRRGNLDGNKASFHNLHSDPAQAGILTENLYPGSVNFEEYINKIDNKIVALESANGEELLEGIKITYSMLRRAIEKAVEERIFGKVINRWSDQIQLHNVPRATLDKNKLESAKSLHEKFSRYIEAHNQSDEMIQHAMPDDLTQLKSDIALVKQIAARNARG